MSCGITRASPPSVLTSFICIDLLDLRAISNAPPCPRPARYARIARSRILSAEPTSPAFGESARHPEQGSRERRMSIEDALAANEAFYRAFNQKDTAAMSVVWSESVEVGCVHPGWNVLTGREPVMESWI